MSPNNDDFRKRSSPWTPYCSQLTIAGKFIRKNLDRHIDLQPGATGAVHFSHSRLCKAKAELRMSEALFRSQAP
jgi:hypothetical protein